MPEKEVNMSTMIIESKPRGYTIRKLSLSQLRAGRKLLDRSGELLGYSDIEWPCGPCYDRALDTSIKEEWRIHWIKILLSGCQEEAHIELVDARNQYWAGRSIGRFLYVVETINNRPSHQYPNCVGRAYHTYFPDFMEALEYTRWQGSCEGITASMRRLGS